MSRQIDTAYYAARAREEHRMAEVATHPRAAAVHAELAARYEALSADPSFSLTMIEPMMASSLMASPLGESPLMEARG